MKNLLLSMLTAAALILTGCESGVDSPSGFSLPEGDVTKGEAVFVKYQCLSCHQMEGVTPTDVVNNPELSVKLGGKTSGIKTYAELVTSVINPSHKIAKGYPKSLLQVDGVSKMKNYNDVMTVGELADLVFFLQSNYELTPYPRTQYRYYETL
ncbi:c-type cytochrome [Moritella sp. Urea-trap-13]|uniref:c-type cytochrome n=1 Tax=Moritella sp. Urea-trap-13 TaxID=2058327 RepID=UPI000C335000|nr:c-type cytochrome [Moritella sp. Urea-trap-13]PKH06065.1 cytochrome C [Moritella sp. Urea-trap-13]